MPAMPVALIGSVSRFLVRKACAQHLLRLVHDLEELRIEMAQQRRGHRSQDARMGVAGAGAEQAGGATDSVGREVSWWLAARSRSFVTRSYGQRLHSLLHQAANFFELRRAGDARELESGHFTSDQRGPGLAQCGEVPCRDRCGNDCRRRPLAQRRGSPAPANREQFASHIRAFQCRRPQLSAGRRAGILPRPRAPHNC